MANILMLSHNSIPDVRIEKEANALRSAGHSIYLVTPQIKEEIAKEPFDKVFVYDHSFKHNFFVRSAVRDGVKYCLDLIDKYKIDIIHAHNLFTAYYSFKAAKKRNLLVVYDDHETWSLYLRERAKAGLSLVTKILRYYVYKRVKIIEKRIAKQSDLIIVTNLMCVDFYDELGIDKEKIIALENVTLQSEIDEALKSKDLILDVFKTDKRKKIINVYRHNVDKRAEQRKRDERINRNFDAFIEATEILDDWVLVLVGNKNPELEKRGVLFLDIMPRIQYLANCAQADVGINPLQINDKTLLSSQNRIFDLALLGVRTISSRTPLLEQNFEDKLIWFNPDEPEEKLIDILKNIDKYPSGEELRRYSKKFSWDKEAAKMLTAYKEILKV